MNEQQFTEKWNAEKSIYLGWGNHVCELLNSAIAEIVSPIPLEYFVKIPAKPRVKADDSLIEKAFRRPDKKYTDPYNEITDKVGVRYVVLLVSDLNILEKAVCNIPNLSCSRDRYYQDEQEQNPLQFDYAAIHYVVRPIDDVDLNGIKVPAGTPCEIQLKTILQHAYSELTHDNLYKGTIETTPAMRRSAAKSSALIEATNDYFQDVVRQVSEHSVPLAQISTIFIDHYNKLLSIRPSPTRLEGILVESMKALIDEHSISAIVEKFKSDILPITQIKQRAVEDILFRQPSIIAAYVLVILAPSRLKAIWPLTEKELAPIFQDMGVSLDNT